MIADLGLRIADCLLHFLPTLASGTPTNFRNPTHGKSAIRNPQSAIRNPKSKEAREIREPLFSTSRDMNSLMISSLLMPVSTCRSVRC